MLAERRKKELEEIVNGKNSSDRLSSVELEKGEHVLAIDRSSILKEMFDDRQEASIKNRLLFAAQQQFIRAELPIDILEHYINFYSHGVDLNTIPRLEICEKAVQANRLLKTLPEGTLRRIKRKNYGAIHNYFFSGNLSRFPTEYLEFKKIGKADLFADRYGIENMTRILSSLKGVLEVDPDDIYPELDPQSKLLVRNLAHGLVVTTEKEISIRNTRDFTRKVCYMCAEDGLKFGASKMLMFKGRLLVVGFNSEVAFTWDPNQDYFIRPFYTTNPYNDITKLEIVADLQGNISIEVTAGDQIFEFLNFEQIKKENLASGIEIRGVKFKYSEGIKALVGVGSDGEEIILNTAQIWQMILELPQLSDTIQTLVSDSECRKEILNNRLEYNRVLSNGMLTKCTVAGKDYICLRFMVMFGAVENLSLLVFLEYVGNKFSISGFHLSRLKNSFITFDILEGEPESIIIGNLAFGSGSFNLIQHFHVVQFADFFTLNEVSGALPYPENDNEIINIKTIKRSREAIAFDDHRNVHIYSTDSNEVISYGPLDDRIVSIFPFDFS